MQPNVAPQHALPVAVKHEEALMHGLDGHGRCQPTRAAWTGGLYGKGRLKGTKQYAVQR